MESFSARVSWAGNSDNKLELDWELRSTHTHETRGVACLGRDNSAARTPDEGFPRSCGVGGAGEIPQGIRRTNLL